MSRINKYIKYKHKPYLTEDKHTSNVKLSTEIEKLDNFAVKP